MTTIKLSPLAEIQVKQARAVLKRNGVRAEVARVLAGGARADVPGLPRDPAPRPKKPTKKKPDAEDAEEKCGACGAEVDEGQKFCSECGASLLDDDDDDDDDDDHDDHDDDDDEEEAAMSRSHGLQQRETASGGAFKLDALDEGARKFVLDQAAREGKSEDQIVAAVNKTLAKRSAAKIAEASRAAAIVAPPVPTPAPQRFSLNSLDEGARKFLRGEAERQGITESEALVRINAGAAARAARGGR